VSSGSAHSIAVAFLPAELSFLLYCGTLEKIAAEQHRNGLWPSETKG